MGWKPCESGTGCNGGQPMSGASDYGYDGWPTFLSGDPDLSAPGSSFVKKGLLGLFRAAMAGGGSFSYFDGLGFTSNLNYGTNGLGGYVGGGFGVGQSSSNGKGRPTWQSSLSVGDPIGWGLRTNVAASAFGQQASFSSFVNTSGINLNMTVTPGGGGTANITFGYRW